MSCSSRNCVEGRVMLEDDSTAKGWILAVCPGCRCVECESDLTDGLCIYGCALKRRFSSEAVWQAAGDAMHERALWAETIPQRNHYRRLRAFCDSKAMGVRLAQQRTLDLWASFDHVFAGVSQ